ncbi:hypothetical protein [Thalassospira sp. A3_1]|uniref:hypothetical protein n=1 Tax=Thalassospira sp. A3_1 TaxID=2821088 RepID=UPI001AD9CD10|nr:hypothetical protein [Thalassospira sp. A3_1]MBO9506672.1 hypothetical protein [Thalassospira sp. A3_1]
MIKNLNGKISFNLVTIVSKITRENLNTINNNYSESNITLSEILEKIDNKSEIVGKNLRKSSFYTIIVDILLVILKNNPDFTIVFLGTSFKKFDGLMEILIFASCYNFLLSFIYLVSLTFYQNIIKQICEQRTNNNDKFILYSSYFEAAPSEFLFDSRYYSSFPKTQKLVTFSGLMLILFIFFGMIFHFYASAVAAIEIVSQPLLNLALTWAFVVVALLFSTLLAIQMLIIAIIPIVTEHSSKK